MKTTTAFFLLLGVFITCLAQTPQSDRQQFIRVDATVIALTHVRVIDGTGAAPLEDQTIVIADGKIQSITPTASAKVQSGAQMLDLKGYSVLPGLVGMHDHMFFPMGGSPPMYSDMGTSFPRLYLALGVTTIRTTGSVTPYTDLEIKRLIDRLPNDWSEDARHGALSGRPRLVHAGDARIDRAGRRAAHGELLG